MLSRYIFCTRGEFWCVFEKQQEFMTTGLFENNGGAVDEEKFDVGNLNGLPDYR